MPDNNAAIAILEAARDDILRQADEIDVAIRKLKAPEGDAKATKLRFPRSSGQVTAADAALDVLGKSSDPCNSTEIAAAIEEAGLGNFNANAIATALNRLKKKGLVDSVPETRPAKWILPAGQTPASLVGVQVFDPSDMSA